MRKKRMFSVKLFSLAVYNAVGILFNLCLIWRLGSLSAIPLNQQSTHTKKNSIMDDLTPTTLPCPATVHSANISGKEINSTVLSARPP
jgi:hypothetical protein